MQEGTRPGGLTALAVLNFVFGGINLLAFAGALMVVAKPEIVPLEAYEVQREEPDEAQRAADRETLREQVQRGARLGLLNGLLATLQVVAGIGYLQQRRVLGRYVGNAYAVFSLALTAFVVATIPRNLPGSGFTPLVLLDLIYPIVTLALLNTTFRDDLSR